MRFAAVLGLFGLFGSVVDGSMSRKSRSLNVEQEDSKEELICHGLLIQLMNTPSKSAHCFCEQSPKIRGLAEDFINEFRDNNTEGVLMALRSALKQVTVSCPSSPGRDHTEEALRAYSNAIGSVV